MTREQVVRAMQLAGLSDDQIQAALARLEIEANLPKFARALRRLGAQVTFIVKGSNWSAEIDGLQFSGTLDESAVNQSPRQGGTKRQSGDSARAILRDLQARGVEVTEAALQYAAAYITRTKRLQDAIKSHPDLHERARKLGLLP
jgi:hypothetical protein